MYKLVVFDLDGTLLNTLEDLRCAYNNVYKTYGLRDITPLEMRQNLGYGNRRLIEDTYRIITGNEIDSALLDEMTSVWSKEYADCYLNQTKEYDGITDLLKHLVNKGIKLGVISNKKDEFVKKLIYKCFNDIEFADVIGDSPLYPRKPDPTSLLFLADKENVDIRDVLYIGDSENDFKVAENAGCDSMLVTWGFRDKEYLESLKPTYLADNIEEIIKLF